MEKIAYYKNRAQHLGSRFLRIVINMVMVVLLIAAIMFVLWLNLLAAPPSSATSMPVSNEPPRAATNQPAPEPTAAPVEAPAGSPATPPKVAASEAVAPTTSAAGAAAGGIVLPRLIIPVAGVKPNQLRDTFASARSEGRSHNALDIMAARATPVLAVAGGVIRRLMQSDRGGTSIYQLSADGKMVYYYAHLERYADGLTEGKEVRQGEVIAYVGDTGNAGAGNCHLHFAMWMISDPKRFWSGENVNPYLLLSQ